MNGPAEEIQIAHVIERLEEKFPAVPPGEVARVVSEQHHALDGNPLRDYVPRLVEHAARDRLRGASAAATP